MKKLTILAFVAVVAISANAASTSWQITAGNLYDHTGSSLFTGLVEVYASGGGLSSDLLMGTLSGNSTYAKAPITVSSGLEGDVAYDIYFKLIDGNYTFTSDTKNVTAVETGAASVLFGNMKTATQTTSNWQSSSPTPEPTSGLLLLLGIAGLALKRKRA